MQEVILATVTDYLAKFRGEQYRLRHLTKQLAEEPERVLARDNMGGTSLPACCCSTNSARKSC